jgi:excisionase family DNA binding protein
MVTLEVGCFMYYPDLPEKTHLSVGEAAEFLGVSQRTIRRWHHTGLMKGTYLDGSLWIAPKSILDLISPRRHVGATCDTFPVMR